jgi:hypothetical protein
VGGVVGEDINMSRQPRKLLIVARQDGDGYNG